jgi:hypothetical protein
MGLIRKNVSGCFRKMPELFLNLIKLPAGNALPDPVPLSLAEF